jgi:hypothetical protein
MHMPKLGARHERLLSFVGDWEGSEQLMPSAWGPGGIASGRMTFRAALAGFAVLQDYVEHKDGQVSFLGHGVFTVDPETEDILWYWFDSFGFPPSEPARGSFEGDVLTMSRVTPRGAARYTYQLTENQCTFTIENKFPGQSEFSRFMTGTYARLA